MKFDWTGVPEVLKRDLLAQYENDGDASFVEAQLSLYRASCPDGKADILAYHDGGHVQRFTKPSVEELDGWLRLTPKPDDTDPSWAAAAAFVAFAWSIALVLAWVTS